MGDARPHNRSYLLFFLLAASFFAIALHAGHWLTGGGESLVAEDRGPLVPPVPDFATIEDVEARKAAFFDFLEPYVDAENSRILEQRAELERLLGKVREGLKLTRKERAFISTISEQYEIATVVQDTEYHLRQVLRRVDVIPRSLVLAQAANESAWGTSRFATEGNNFFGQWCYSQGCGIVPQKRHEDASHEVEAFASVKDSVHAYFMNINTFPSYVELRRIRARLRARGKALDSRELVKGLDGYSERGEEYVEELRSIINYNELYHRDSAHPAAPDRA